MSRDPHLMHKIVFWQNIPSILQAPVISEFAKSTLCDVTVITESDISTSRKNQGWQRPEFKPAELIIDPSKSQVKDIWQSHNSDSVHIFSGIDAYPFVYKNFKTAVSKSVRIGVFAEPGRHNDFKFLLRKLKYRYHAIRWDNDIDFILPTGQLGVDWFEMNGFSKNSIYPFGYFVRNDIVESEMIGSNKKDSKIEFIFIGQLINRKGLDYLLNAFSKLNNKEWVLRIVGSGEKKDDYKAMVDRLGINDQVIFEGVLPNKNVFEYLKKSDYLILPSRYDGWGAVVNEALTVGTPCIVSSNCGSCDLIQSELQGRVFRSGSISKLGQILNNIIKNNHQTGPEKRKKLREWARMNISPNAGAQYLNDILDFIYGSERGNLKPTAPWRKV
jgi:glycosyltransferase involved in cell wall biosynthesis